MPKRMWDWTTRAVTSDAAGLSILGGAALWRAVSYMPGQVNPDRNPAHWLEGLLPPTGWSWAWMIVGMLCIIAIWQRRIMPVAVGLTVGLNLAWALSFMGIQLAGESARAHVSAIGYFATAGLAFWGFGRGRNPEVVVKLKKE